MQGVEILTSAQVATEMAWNPTAFWISAIIVFSVLFIAGIVISCDNMDFILLVCCIITGVIMGGLFGCLFGKIYETPTAYETQYKVTISDEVSMTEFYEHYEIIEVDGKIFTVREKTDEQMD